MKHVHVLIFLLVAAAAGSAFGQTKVGTTGANFLQLPFSLRSGAMGSVATTLSDCQAYAGNPGSIGLLAARPEISLGPIMWGNNILPGSIDYYGAGTAVPVVVARVPAGERLSLGIAGYVTRLKGGGTVETTWYGVPAGTSPRWRDDSYHLLTGLSINGRLQVGLGTGFTYFRENVSDTTGSWDQVTDGWTVDFGALARFPIALRRASGTGLPIATLRPSVGLAVTNIGPDIEYGTREYPTPRTFRSGIGADLIISNPGFFGGWEALSVAAALEYEKQRNLTGFAKLGAELGLVETVYLRVGHTDEYRGANTWGFAVGSAGLMRVLVWAFGDPTQVSPTADFFVSRLSLQYAQSRIALSGVESDQPMRGFTLTYRYGD